MSERPLPVIDGLRLRYDGSQIIRHCDERVRWHTKQLANVDDALKSARAHLRMISGSSTIGKQFKSEEAELVGKRRFHARQIALFEAIVEHLPSETSFRLSVQDLEELELLWIYRDGSLYYLILKEYLARSLTQDEDGRTNLGPYFGSIDWHTNVLTACAKVWERAGGRKLKPGQGPIEIDLSVNVRIVPRWGRRQV